MSTLSKNSPSISIPINNYQIIPVSSLWTNTQVTSPNPIIRLINTNPNPINTSSSSAAPRVTTTLIPLNVCPTEYCQTVKSTPIPSISIVQNNKEQTMFENKSKGTITTHVIGDWIIRERSEPVQRKENEQLTTPIEQIVNPEKQVISNESITFYSYSSKNVNQWTYVVTLIIIRPALSLMFFHCRKH
ncbi:unnamed protein product [Rotaria sp. Silwood1]|nr:unnamed protein product [Rotaria sp. Silwood1]